MTPVVQPGGATTPSPSRMRRIFRWVVDVRDGEEGAALWAFAFFFCLMAGYYVLRPLREEMGTRGGTKNLPWLFLGTFLTSLALVPIYSAIVARFPRRVMIPIVYRFLAANLLLFWCLFRFAGPDHQVGIARAFFIWTTVYVVFVVAVLWSFMADIFSQERGKRLFAFIGAGGTVGAVVGSSATRILSAHVPVEALLFVPLVLLEVGVFCTRRLQVAALTLSSDAKTSAARTGEPVGGTMLDGFLTMIGSPYLVGIGAYILLTTMMGTYGYTFQNALVKAAHGTSEARVAAFADINLYSNSLSLILQLMTTSRLIARFGVGRILAILPALNVVGFTVLGVQPTLDVLFWFEVLRRAFAFAFTSPSREVLFTITSRDVKYKSKSFIDVVIYRGGDYVSSQWTGLLFGFGLDIAAISWTGVPLSIAWMWLAGWLGRKKDQLAPAAAPSRAT